MNLLGRHRPACATRRPRASLVAGVGVGARRARARRRTWCVGLLDGGRPASAGRRHRRRSGACSRTLVLGVRVWPLAGRPARGPAMRARRARARLAALLAFAHPVAAGRRSRSSVAVLAAASTVVFAALVTVSVALCALIACRYVLPAADRLEAQLAARAARARRGADPDRPPAMSDPRDESRPGRPGDDHDQPRRPGPRVPAGRVDPGRPRSDGFFARDTRFVSGYELRLNGAGAGAPQRGPDPLLLGALRVHQPGAPRPRRPDPRAQPVDPRSTGRSRRRPRGPRHRQLRPAPGRARRRARSSLSDFADIFDVKGDGVVPRGHDRDPVVPARRELRTRYRNADVPARARGRRGAVRRPRPVRQRPAARSWPRSRPRASWHACLSGCRSRAPAGPPAGRAAAATPSEVPLRQAGVSRLPAVGARRPRTGTSSAPGHQAVRDLEALRLEDPTFERGVVVPAAGVPWFVTLFGRDSLIVVDAGDRRLPGVRGGRAAPAGRAPGDEDDPERDMEPGKIPHEIRHGELTRPACCRSRRTTAPTTPRRSTSIVALVPLPLDSATRRSSSATCGRAEAAMRWIDQLRRSRRRRLPGVRDALDARLLQPGLEGRRRRDPARGRHARAAAARAVRAPGLRLRRQAPDGATCTTLLGRRRGRRAGCGAQAADACTTAFNDAFWWEAEGTYYLGLDGAEAADPHRRLERGPPAAVRDRAARPRRAGWSSGCCADDMWSGWGIRTLSVRPPVRTTRSATTRARSGRTTTRSSRAASGATASRPRRRRSRTGIFDAASQFPAHRLPELFAGLPRDDGVVPGAVPGRERAPGVGGGVGLPARRGAVRASTPRPTRQGRGCTSTRRCPRGCPS